MYPSELKILRESINKVGEDEIIAISIALTEPDDINIFFSSELCEGTLIELLRNCADKLEFMQDNQEDAHLYNNVLYRKIV